MYYLYSISVLGAVILGLLLPLPLPRFRFRFPQNAVILLVAIPPMNLEVADTANRFRFRFQNPAFDTSSLLISISSLKLSLPSFYFWRICSSVGPSVGPSIGPSVSPSVRPSVHRFVHWSKKSVCPSVHWSVHLSVYK